MTKAEKIKRFDEKNKPFYIVDHDNGEYSLCLPLAFLKDEYKDYGQEAFNRYAEEIGDPIAEGRLFTHGSGYEWEIVFKKAFESDKNLSRIQFDCELDGFFCNCKDLDLLLEFGYRFKSICDDSERFAELVSKGLCAAAYTEKAMEQVDATIGEFIKEFPEATLDLMTPGGYVYLTPEQGKALLNGSVISAHLGASGTHYDVAADEILSQRIHTIRQDDDNPTCFHMITDYPNMAESEDEGFTMNM